MPLITRQGKGEKLTIQEMDGNLEYLEGLSQDIESSVSVIASDLQAAVPYLAYCAKIAMQTIDWPGYGYLYNWYAVDSVLGFANPAGGTGLIAPNEWRVPSDGDWNTLVTFAGGDATKLKSTLSSTGYPFYGWVNNSGGTDDYNFNVLPGGYRVSVGFFDGIGITGSFWSTTNAGSDATIYVFTAFQTGISNAFSPKSVGRSVRLVREATAGELLLADGDTSDTSSLDPYTGNDGKTYVTVKIGTQVWLAQNIRETRYNDDTIIFNAAQADVLPGGDGTDATWQAKGPAQEGAFTAYLFGSGAQVEYDPTTIKVFYNEVLENTIITFGTYPTWVASSDANGPFYALSPVARPWQKTHIKITPGYEVSDFPTINEKSLIVERAVGGETQIVFRPIKKDGTTGAITIEDLNNYNDGDPTSYVYVEILEYSPSYYNSMLGIGVNNL